MIATLKKDVRGMIDTTVRRRTSLFKVHFCKPSSDADSGQLLGLNINICYAERYLHLSIKIKQDVDCNKSFSAPVCRIS